jgi:regulator of RNase E activity RraA
MNLPIKINGVPIQNNDIIFADQDGAVCIPQNKWEIVFSKIKENLKKEMEIKLDATFGSNPSEILEKRGIF